MIDVEIGSKEFIKNQHFYLDKIKESNPIVKTKSGYTLITKYNDVAQALKNDSFVRQIINPSDSHYHSLLNIDGKDHLKYRKMLGSAFSNSSMKNIEKLIITNINNEIENIKKNKNKTINLINDIAFKIPFYTICEILGVIPPKDEDLLNIQKLSVDTLLILNLELSKEDLRKSIKASNEIMYYVTNLIFGNKYKKKNGLITYLQSTYYDGKKISNEEILTFIILLLVAGFETNVNSITSSIYNILSQQKVKEEFLHLDTSLVSSAKISDELIRHSTSVNFVTRKAIKDSYVGSGEHRCLVKEGDMVLFHLGSANRDSEVFINPHEININRKNSNKHLAFGSGPHYCVGATLSRIQVSSVVVNVLKSFKNLRIVGDPIVNSNFGIAGFQEIYATYE